MAFQVHPDERNSLRLAAERLVHFIDAHGVEVIILEGRSARPIADLLRPAWKNLNPGKKMPRIFAIGNRVKKHAGLERDSTRKLAWPEFKKFDYSAFEKELNATMPALMQNRDKRTLLLTEMTASGLGFDRVREIFNTVGFSNLFSGTLFSVHGNMRSMDFIGVPYATKSSFFAGKRSAYRRGLTAQERENQRAIRTALRKIGGSVQPRPR
jgi:hypothetical protein